MQAQFAPQVGFEGTKAIHKADVSFIDWANNAEIIRGYKNIAIPENGFVDFGLVDNAIQKADGNPNIISLGDGGEIIVTFNHTIVNGIGADFAVFENGFLKEENSALAFLELAFVEVSSDGEQYVRFPAISNLPTTNQINSFGFIDAKNIYNFAGKYINHYGTPFDLSELTPLVNNTTVDLNNINYIKIIDVVGTINNEFARFDSQNNKVNDPYPSEFSSGGFDLDAVGVINNTTNTSDKIIIYPNPVSEFLKVKSNNLQVNAIQIYSMDGKLVFMSDIMQQEINVSKLISGLYLFFLETNDSVFKKVFFKN
ncbi:MAG TPA: T9SS type A sorting domain-containing protein [Lutibacter sp.]|nr:T9SS type A sorting domain-containing protein [Lutibacter sp.]